MSHFDLNKSSLADLITNNFSSGKIKIISHTAYNAEVFESYINYIYKKKYKPDLIVIPINMRSFSPQWQKNPAWQFDCEVKLINSMTNSDPLITFSFLKKEVILWIKNILYLYYKADFSLTRLNRVKDFKKIIADKSNKIYSKEYRLKHLFIFHYLYKLQKNNKNILSLLNILTLSKKIGAKLFFYITPINYEAGNAYAGKNFTKFLNKNISQLMNILNSNNFSIEVKIVDLSKKLESSFFFHPNDSTEHLNFKGRKALARIINENLSFN